MEFKLYTGPTCDYDTCGVWTETRIGGTSDSRVAVSGGLFSLLLGKINDFSGVDFSQPLYLGINIGGPGASPSWDGEMTPRKELGSVPYSLASSVADTADTLDSLDSLSFLRSDIDTIAQGNISVVGSMGIGTLSPEAKFHVQNGEIWAFYPDQNPRILIGDNSTTGQYGFLQWDSLNDYFRIETLGTNGLKIKDNYISIGNIYPSQPLIVGDGSTELFRVQNDGKVGIGTAVPERKLEVYDVTPAIRYNRAGEYQWTVGISGVGDTLGAPYSYFVIRDDPYSVPRLVISHTDGNVGIGTTVPNKKLDVEGAVEINLPGTGTNNALCHTTRTGTINEEIVDCTGSPRADYAEQFPVAEDIEYGDLVATGERIVTTTDGDKIVQLIKSSQPYQENIIGIISNNYDDFTSTGYNIKEEDNPMPVALSGRVLLKVSLENGPIAIGDPLTSSSEPGVAMKATKTGRVIGIALESYAGKGTGKAMVFLNPHWWGGTTESGIAALNSGGTVGAEVEVEYSWSINFLEALSVGLEKFGLVIKDGIAKVKELIADKIITKKLCLEEDGEPVCIDKSQLKQLLNETMSSNESDIEQIEEETEEIKETEDELEVQHEAEPEPEPESESELGPEAEPETEILEQTELDSQSENQHEPPAEFGDSNIVL
jgi:hypothetical protein